MTNDLTVKMLFGEWMEVVKFWVMQSILANYLGKAEIHILPSFDDILTDELGTSRVQQFVAAKSNDDGMRF